MRLRTILTRGRLELVADALVVTAAGFALVIGLTAILLAPSGEPRAGLEWAAAVASLLAMASAIALPITIWLLHGRRLTWQAVLGGVVGAASAGVVFMAVAALSGVLGLLASPFTDFEYAGPLLMLGVVSLGFAAVGVWRLVDAIRDLRSAAPRSRSLDLLRIAAVIVLVAFVAGTGWWVAAHPGDESGEAPIFMMLVGLSGALAVAGAEALSSLASGGAIGAPSPPAGGSPPGAPG